MSDQPDSPEQRPDIAEKPIDIEADTLEVAQWLADKYTNEAVMVTKAVVLVEAIDEDGDTQILAMQTRMPPWDLMGLMTYFIQRLKSNLQEYWWSEEDEE